MGWYKMEEGLTHMDSLAESHRVIYMGSVLIEFLPSTYFIVEKDGGASLQSAVLF